MFTESFSSTRKRIEARARSRSFPVVLTEQVIDPTQLLPKPPEEAALRPRCVTETYRLDLWIRFTIITIIYLTLQADSHKRTLFVSLHAFVWKATGNACPQHPGSASQRQAGSLHVQGER